MAGKKENSMELTGKCKEEFNKWLPHSIEVLTLGLDGRFETFPEAMKYSVYVDFFDEESKYRLNLNTTDTSFYWKLKIIGGDKGVMGFSGFTNTREQSRIEIINKANDLYNGRITEAG